MDQADKTASGLEINYIILRRAMFSSLSLTRVIQILPVLIHAIN